MQSNLESVRERVWKYLESGQWDNALAAESYLAQLGRASSDDTILAGHIARVAQTADAIRFGTKLEEASVQQLETAARELPRLAALPAFQSLLNATLAAARRMESVEQSGDTAKTPMTQAQQSQDKSHANRKSPPRKIKLIAAITGKAGPSGRSFSSGARAIVVSILVCLSVILLADSMGYVYLKRQPENVSGTLTEWSGIYTWAKPVDTLLLGDSTCGYNLSTGPFADRLGGRVVNLGNFATTSFMMDAWMLAAYIQRFGPPRNVVLLRSSPRGYALPHITQYMAELPLGWDFWQKFGIAPDWNKGEVFRLFLDKYFVLYSDADILQKRLVEPMSLFKHKIGTVYPSSLLQKAL